MLTCLLGIYGRTHVNKKISKFIIHVTIGSQKTRPAPVAHVITTTTRPDLGPMLWRGTDEGIFLILAWNSLSRESNLGSKGCYLDHLTNFVRGCFTISSHIIVNKENKNSSGLHMFNIISVRWPYWLATLGIIC